MPGTAASHRPLPTARRQLHSVGSKSPSASGAGGYRRGRQPHPETTRPAPGRCLDSQRPPPDALRPPSVHNISRSWGGEGDTHFRDLSYCSAITFAIAAPIMVGGGWLTTQAGIFLLASALFLVLVSRIDTIAEMSVGPMRARMRDTISEAESILSHLRSITRIMAKMSIAKFMMGNFWLGNVPLRQQFSIHDELILQMKKLGLSDDEIEDADATWKAGIKMMYVNIITNALQSVDEQGRVPSGQPENVRTLRKKSATPSTIRLWKACRQRYSAK